MILTLYKNCILNDKYYEVFDTKKRGNNDKSAFVTYIEGLDNTVIEVENVYVKYYGNILLPYDVATGITALDYNYMKVENEEQTIYAFINSIELVNQVVNLTYAQDVWANWSDKCTIRQGLLSLLNGVSPQVEVRGIPVDIATGSPLIPDTIKQFDGTDKDPFSEYFTLVGDIQFHDLVSADKTEEREQYAVVFGLLESSSDEEPIVNNKLTLSNAMRIALRLLKNENRDCVYTYTSNSTDPWGKNILPYYDIVKLYLIPYSKTIIPFINPVYAIVHDGYTPGGKGCVTVGLLNSYYVNECQYTIQQKNYNESDISYTLAGIGIADDIIPIKYGGFGLNGSLNLIVGSKSCEIVMKVGGTIRDVTPYFELPIWFSPISDSSFEQRVLNYDLNKKLLFLSKARNTLDLKANASRMRRENDIEKKFDLGVEALNTGLNLIENGIRKSALNAEVYGNFEKNNSSGSPFLNAYYGLRMFIYEPANPNFISDIIDNYGFEVEKYVKNLDLMLFDGEERLLGDSPCSCTFAWINITGNAPQNILRQLEEILLKNTKIYYNGTIS